ncbi:mechanosensitive ion channel family protein [Cupriavidus taiwanensis]|uniref:Small-conductance mechanosensitive channel n=1 Tax=Cupriavidus taiwanensis TaxID=164546 RepID=A0A375J9P1_9BURK|nr:mechanosensitive ion channel domain-containing protein [Cupriavidus taiwanensis]SPS01599.1 Putative Mechanosensitive ion channel, MscS family [Cupriavidus taiwanensis]
MTMVFLLMRRLPVLAILLWLGIAAARAAPDPAAETEAAPVEVRLMNRPIAVLRATLAGVTPEARARRARDRFAALTTSDLLQPVRTSPGELAGQHGEAIYIGDRLLLAVVEGDRDPEDKGSFEALLSQTVDNVSQVVAARRQQQHWPTLIRGVLRAGGTLAVAILLGWALTKTRRSLGRLVDASLQRHLKARTADGFDWTAALYQLTDRIVRILAVALFALVAFVWLEFSLLQFPLTHPLGERMGAYLWRLLEGIGAAMVSAIPGLLVVAIILFITRGVQAVVASVFTATERGNLTVPGLHPETVPATRRLAAVLVWALGFTFAYPYIPGSQSDVFKGVSVLLGFMLTLGSANVVNQLMSGMVLVYARALRVGDMVSIGDTVGWVESLGPLSVRLVNLRQEQVTLPNAVVVGSAVHNYSRSGDINKGSAALLSSAVTIGYDTPWRQVHALLLNAARQVPGLDPATAPFVLQRGLSDFYVEYELFFAIEDPRRRFFALSTLHAAIQDEFNRHNVQIMSPHFVLQPKDPVMVPTEQWHAPPATPPVQQRSDG